MDAVAIRQVRLIIADTDPARQILSDLDIDDFLTIEAASVKRAAATALDAIASSEALTSKVIRTQDLSTDGAKTAEALRAHARALRAQADDSEADGDSAFAVVEFCGYDGFPELAEGRWL